MPTISNTDFAVVCLILAGIAALIGGAVGAAASGAAPGKAGVKASFRHGNQGSGAKNKDKEGYDHQDSYNDPRAQWAALYSIVKIAQLANWHG